MTVAQYLAKIEERYTDVVRLCEDRLAELGSGELKIGDIERTFDEILDIADDCQGYALGARRALSETTDQSFKATHDAVNLLMHLEARST